MRDIPASVVDALHAGKVVDVGPVRLRGPKDPGARGAKGQFRMDWYDAVGTRKYAGRTQMQAAWDHAYSLAEQATVRAPDTMRNRPEMLTLADAVTLYLRPDAHPDWSDSRRSTVTTLMKNWVAHPRVTVTGPDSPYPAALLDVEALTPTVMHEILAHVHQARAFRTYIDTRRELMTLLRWLHRERLLSSIDFLDRVKKAKAIDFRDSRAVGVAPVDPDDIPSREKVNRLRDEAQNLSGDDGALMVDMLAYGGLRIGELFGLTPAAMWLDPEDNVYRPHINQQVLASGKISTPKHGRTRHGWLPPFLTDTVTARLAQCDNPNRPIFQSSTDGWIRSNNWRRRSFNAWMTAAGWPKVDPDDRRQRTWKWTAHSLRHYCATWMLNELGLQPDDVATFLGHGSGQQIWLMYAVTSPGLTSRATRLASAAGDPRTLTLAPLDRTHHAA